MEKRTNGKTIIFDYSKNLRKKANHLKIKIIVKVLKKAMNVEYDEITDILCDQNAEIWSSYPSGQPFKVSQLEILKVLK